jgi:hypothetical protein
VREEGLAHSFNMDAMLESVGVSVGYVGDSIPVSCVVKKALITLAGILGISNPSFLTFGNHEAEKYP